METTATAPPKPIHLPQSLTAIVALVLVVSALVAGYQMTLTPITLVVDGRSQELRTHQDTVATLLMDVGLSLYPEDIVIHREEIIHAPNVDALDVAIDPESPVEVRRARSVRINADGIADGFLSRRYCNSERTYRNPSPPAWPKFWRIQRSRAWKTPISK